MAEAGINWQIADALTARQLRVRQAERRERDEVLAILAVLQADLLAALKLADPFERRLLAAQLRAIEELVTEEWTPMVTTAYARLAAETRAFLTTLATQEAEAVQTIVQGITDTEVLPEMPGTRDVRRRVVLMPIPSPQRPTDLSATGDEWWRRQGEGLVTRLGDQMRVSATLAETLPQAQQRLTGTPERGFQDGIMQRAREDAVRLLTTQVTNAASEAHVATVAANPATAILVHSSILDSKTSYVCLARHGLRYRADTHEPIGHDIPYLNGVPYHPNCRSSLNPATLRGGPIPEANLDAWLRRQSRARQDEILGPTRARLWREGRLRSTRDLLDAATGRPLTLEELGVH